MATKKWVVTAGFGRIRKNRSSTCCRSRNARAGHGAHPDRARNLGLGLLLRAQTSGDVTVAICGRGFLSLVETKAKLGGGATVGG